MNDVRMKPSVKHGEGSTKVWGCLTANGKGDLVRINEIMNAEKYRQILINHAILSSQRLIGNGFIFLPDNDPKTHCIKVKKNYLERKEQSGDVQVMKLPLQSPDLNIIKSLWDYLDQRKAEKLPKSKERLW